MDSDGDGFVDDYEMATGHDPNNISDYPSLGDIDGDGRSDAVDAIILYRWIKGKITLPEPPCPKGDVNRDGHCDTIDALSLYRWSIGLPGYETLPMN